MQQVHDSLFLGNVGEGVGISGKCLTNVCLIARPAP